MKNPNHKLLRSLRLNTAGEHALSRTIDAIVPAVVSHELRLSLRLPCIARSVKSASTTAEIYDAHKVSFFPMPSIAGVCAALAKGGMSCTPRDAMNEREIQFWINCTRVSRRVNVPSLVAQLSTEARAL